MALLPLQLNILFLSLSLWQYWLWPGSTGVGESVGDTRTGLQRHRHCHHSLQPPSENRNHSDKGEYAQNDWWKTVIVIFSWCTFLYYSHSMWPWWWFLTEKMLCYRLYGNKCFFVIKQSKLNLHELLHVDGTQDIIPLTIYYLYLKWLKFSATFKKVRAASKKRLH